MADIVDVMGALLKRHRVPTVAAISQVLSPFTGLPARELGVHINRHLVSHFFCHKGRVEHVVKAVVEEAARFYDAREGEGAKMAMAVAAVSAAASAAEEEEKKKRAAGEGCSPFRAYHGLPICMLDGDFDFVQALLIPGSV